MIDCKEPAVAIGATEGTKREDPNPSFQSVSSARPPRATISALRTSRIGSKEPSVLACVDVARRLEQPLAGEAFDERLGHEPAVDCASTTVAIGVGTTSVDLGWTRPG